jgi:hypothetical protein
VAVLTFFLSTMIFVQNHSHSPGKFALIQRFYGKSPNSEFFGLILINGIAVTCAEKNWDILWRKIGFKHLFENTGCHTICNF